MKPKFKVPKQFDLAGNTFKVIVKEGMTKGGIHGQTHYDAAEIWIDKDLKPEDLKAITFYHELVHALFNTLGKDDLKNDEGLVDSMGNLLWQFHKSARY
jgi:Zn-dependent peptidase ImmA (M78 family)